MEDRRSRIEDRIICLVLYLRSSIFHPRSSGEFVRRSFLAIILLSFTLAVSQPSNYAQVKRESAKPSATAQGRQDKAKSATRATQEKRGTAKHATAAGQLGNVEAITAAQLKEWLYVVASDDMEGRDTPSRGLDLTAKFIADHLSQWGVKPGGDDGTSSPSRHRDRPADRSFTSVTVT